MGHSTTKRVLLILVFAMCAAQPAASTLRLYGDKWWLLAMLIAPLFPVFLVDLPRLTEHPYLTKLSNTPVFVLLAGGAIVLFHRYPDESMSNDELALWCGVALATSMVVVTLTGIYASAAHGGKIERSTGFKDVMFFVGLFFTAGNLIAFSFAFHDRLQWRTSCKPALENRLSEPTVDFETWLFLTSPTSDQIATQPTSDEKKYQEAGENEGKQLEHDKTFIEGSVCCGGTNDVEALQTVAPRWNSRQLEAIRSQLRRPDLASARVFLLGGLKDEGMAIKQASSVRSKIREDLVKDLPGDTNETTNKAGTPRSEKERVCSQAEGDLRPKTSFYLELDHNDARCRFVACPSRDAPKGSSKERVGGSEKDTPAKASPARPDHYPFVTVRVESEVSKHLTLLDYVYFTGYVITTTGFGDIIPATAFAKFLVSYANAVEFFFVVVFFAILLDGRKEGGG